MPNKQEQLQLVLVDDHVVFRHALATIIETNETLHVAGQAGDAASAFEVIRTVKPDVAIVDVALKGASGFALLEKIKARCPSVKILVLSGTEEHSYAQRSLSAGASGYLAKSASPEELMEAIARVAGGGIHFSAEVRDQILSRIAAGKSAFSDPAKVLSNRETQIFTLYGRGKKTSEVADELGISPKTIEAFRARIKKKLGITGAVAFLRAAIDWLQYLEGQGKGVLDSVVEKLEHHEA